MAKDKEIARVLRKLEYGVYVITMGKGESGNAYTASWLTQVSSEPPMIAIAVHSAHQSMPLIQKHGAFVVNLIAAGQEEVAKTYYGPAESGYDKLKAKDVKDSPATGSPLINGAAGYLDCKVITELKTGNHTVFVGEVVAAIYTGDQPVLTTTNSKLVYTG
jgi:flavin reductase (DIM6/NTAB) family NADH-FMN oxidoreductase RutF